MRTLLRPKSPPGFLSPLTVLFRCLAFALCLTSQNGHALPPTSKEYQIKAAFLFHFAQFVQWPEETFPDAEAPFKIGILGDDPFGNALDETVKGETIRNRKFVIKRSTHIEDLQDCQILFISVSEKLNLAEILSKTAGKKILTVSEIPGFAQQGGMIKFHLEMNKVRFEINPTRAQLEGLKISSELLNLGKIVSSESEVK